MIHRYVKNRNDRIVLRVRDNGLDLCWGYGLPYSQKNCEVASYAARQAEYDLQNGIFDYSKERYKFKREKPVLQFLPDIWKLYREQTDDSVSASTIASRRLVDNQLAALDIKTIDPNSFIHSFYNRLIKIGYSESYAYHLASQLVTACRHFSIKVSSVKRHRQKRPSTIIDVYSEGELSCFLQFIRSQDIRESDKGLLHFLALTGCRPSEVFALESGDISSDFSQATIQRSYVRGVIRQMPKNGKKRIISANSATEAILRKFSDLNDPKSIVFQTTRGKRWSRPNFTRHVFDPLCEKAIQKGILTHRRNLYQFRHTWASIALSHGWAMAQVAAHLGHTVAVCDRHYAGWQPSRITLDI